MPSTLPSLYLSWLVLSGSIIRLNSPLTIKSVERAKKLHWAKVCTVGRESYIVDGETPAFPL